MRTVMVVRLGHGALGAWGPSGSGLVEVGVLIGEVVTTTVVAATAREVDQGWGGLGAGEPVGAQDIVAQCALRVVEGGQADNVAVLALGGGVDIFFHPHVCESALREAVPCVGASEQVDELVNPVFAMGEVREGASYLAFLG